MKIRLFRKIVDVMIKSKAKLYQLTKVECNAIFNDEYDTDLETSIRTREVVKGYRCAYNTHMKATEANYQYILYELVNTIYKVYDNPTLEEIFYSFCYIVRNGYLSDNNEYYFRYPKHECNVRMGLSIMTGEGVCKNLVFLLSDLLKSILHVNAIPIYTDRITYESEEYQPIDLFQSLKERCYDKESVTDEFIERSKNSSFKACNHAEILVTGDNTCVLDPTEISISYFIKEDNGYDIFNYLRLWASYALSELSIREVTELYRNLNGLYIAKNKTQENFELQRKCFELWERNKDILEEFHRNITSEITYINDTLKHY